MSNNSEIDHSSLVDEASEMMKEKGYPNHFQADFIKRIAEEVKGSNKEEFKYYKPNFMQLKGNEAFKIAFKVVIDFLEANQCKLTQDVMELEQDGIVQPEYQDYENSPDADAYLTDLIQTYAYDPDPIEERVQYFYEHAGIDQILENEQNTSQTEEKPKSVNTQPEQKPKEDDKKSGLELNFKVGNVGAKLTLGGNKDNKNEVKVGLTNDAKNDKPQAAQPAPAKQAPANPSPAKPAPAPVKPAPAPVKPASAPVKPAPAPAKPAPAPAKPAPAPAKNEGSDEMEDIDFDIGDDDEEEEAKPVTDKAEASENSDVDFEINDDEEEEEKPKPAPVQSKPAPVQSKPSPAPAKAAPIQPAPQQAEKDFDFEVDLDDDEEEEEEKPKPAPVQPKAAPVQPKPAPVQQKAPVQPKKEEVEDDFDFEIEDDEEEDEKPKPAPVAAAPKAAPIQPAQKKDEDDEFDIDISDDDDEKPVAGQQKQNQAQNGEEVDDFDVDVDEDDQPLKTSHNNSMNEEEDGEEFDIDIGDDDNGIGGGFMITQQKSQAHNTSEVEDMDIQIDEDNDPRGLDSPTGRDDDLSYRFDDEEDEEDDDPFH